MYPYKLHYIFAYKLAYRNIPNNKRCVDVKIKPKYPNAEDVTLRLSFQSRKILEHYSDYTGLTPAQIIEETLPHLLKDDDFIKFVESKRSNIRLKRELGLSDD
ncbi:hypothetical protein CVD19_16870 [Bacillus sp. T33-2]|nr:hypothetical protein CVD19_16870 [Bacillus sp. T33-2]